MVDWYIVAGYSRAGHAKDLIYQRDNVLKGFCDKQKIAAFQVLSIKTELPKRRKRQGNN